MTLSVSATWYLKSVAAGLAFTALINRTRPQVRRPRLGCPGVVGVEQPHGVVAARKVVLKAGNVRVGVDQLLLDDNRLLVGCQGLSWLSSLRQEDAGEVEALCKVELEVGCGRIGLRDFRRRANDRS